MDSIRTLLVEAGHASARAMRSKLARARGASFAVEHRRTLDAALSRVLAGNIDVVLLDLELPDSSGVDAVVQLDAAAPDVPIVVVTDALDQDQDLALRSLQARAEDYLVKSRVDREVLQRTIRHALERHRVQVSRQESQARSHADQESETIRMQGLNRRLERLASTDPLTEVLNRRGLETELLVEVRRKARSGAPLAAVLIDCDDFRRINETLGHAGGDAVLKRVAERLSESLRPSDHIGRIGGDEFLILLPDTRFAEAFQVGQRLRLSLGGLARDLTTGPCPLSASLGIELVPDGSVSLAEVLVGTERALQQSKRNGKNRVSSPDGAAREDASQLDDLVSALQVETTFQVVRQPILRLATQEIIGWELEPRGPVGIFERPRDFLRLALENGVLTQVDLGCLRACLGRALPLPSTCYHINILPSTLVETPRERMREILACQGQGQGLCIEISEQHLIGEPALLRAHVRDLKEAGMRVAIDDVGFGRSSLETLVLLEPDLVKIDPKFVAGIGRDPGKERALARMVGVVASLGSELVADGIASQEEYETVLALGVAWGQGPLWSAPDREVRKPAGTHLPRILLRGCADGDDARDR